MIYAVILWLLAVPCTSTEFRSRCSEFRVASANPNGPHRPLGAWLRNSLNCTSPLSRVVRLRLWISAVEASCVLEMDPWRCRCPSSLVTCADRAPRRLPGYRRLAGEDIDADVPLECAIQRVLSSRPRILCAVVYAQWVNYRQKRARADPAHARGARPPAERPEQMPRCRPTTPPMRCLLRQAVLALRLVFVRRPLIGG